MRRFVLLIFAVGVSSFGLGISPAHAASAVSTTASTSSLTASQSEKGLSSRKVTLGLAWRETGSGLRRLEATGRTTVTTARKVHLQVRRNGLWTEGGFVKVVDGRFRGNVAQLPTPGMAVRGLVGSGDQQVVALATTPEELPFVAELNDVDGLPIDPVGTRVTVEVAAHAGDFVSVTLAATSNVDRDISRVTVVDGTGAKVDLADGAATAANQTVQFAATDDATYTLHLVVAKPTPVTVWASTPVRRSAEIGAVVDVSGRLPFQAVELSFAGEAGVHVSLPDLATGGELLGPDGRVAPWLSTPQGTDVFELPSNGDYLLRLYQPDNTAEVLTTVTAEAVLGADLTVALPDPHAVAVIDITATPDTPFFVDLAPLVGRDAALFAPGGGPALAGATADVPVGGTYHLVVTGLVGSPELTVSVAAPHDEIVS